jgi:hypothetical protein
MRSEAKGTPRPRAGIRGIEIRRPGAAAENRLKRLVIHRPWERESQSGIPKAKGEAGLPGENMAARKEASHRALPSGGLCDQYRSRDVPGRASSRKEAKGRTGTVTCARVGLRSIRGAGQGKIPRFKPEGSSRKE